MIISHSTTCWLLGCIYNLINQVVRLQNRGYVKEMFQEGLLSCSINTSNTLKYLDTHHSEEQLNIIEPNTKKEKKQTIADRELSQRISDPSISEM